MFKQALPRSPHYFKIKIQLGIVLDAIGNPVPYILTLRELTYSWPLKTSSLHSFQKITAIFRIQNPYPCQKILEKKISSIHLSDSDFTLYDQSWAKFLEMNFTNLV